MGRGIEIHNGQIVFPEGMPPELHLGTLASPLTQSEASQIVISAVINATILGGTVIAGLFRVDASASLTGNIYGIQSKAVVDAGVVVDGFVYGGEIRAELGSEGRSINMEGLRVGLGVASDSIVANIYGLHINGMVLVEPTGRYYFQRMSENGAVTLDAAFLITIGGTSDIDHLFMLPTSCSAWDHSAGVTGIERGRIAVQVEGVEKYIKLWDAT